MKRYRLFISIVLTLITFIIALSYYSTPFARQNESSDCFSAIRVARDIRIISKEPHSIEQPMARIIVRDYLAKRFEEMNIPITYYWYDSIKSRLFTEIKIANIYAKVNPLYGEPSSYILLIAHLDSRFRNKVLDKVVYSFGAADDGYGLGVILESVRLALTYRSTWKQGIKILFTDSEENNLDGVRKALQSNPEIFEKVGFIINIEARGVKGPALLFETSPGNENIIKLYKKAKHPAAYSLTTVVYSILPNSSDFTLLRNTYPGMNFSVIDNLNYYHTDLDNIRNISMTSIQHYGDQITPIIDSYLTNSTFSNSKGIKSDNNSVFFSLPFLGLVVFSKSLYLIINILTLFLFCFVIFLLFRHNKIRMSAILKNGSFILIFTIILSFTGFCTAFLTSVITNQKYSIIYLPYIKNDWFIIIVLLLLSIVLYAFLYNRKLICKKLNAYEAIISSASIQVLSSMVFYLFFGENFFFLFPVILALTALLLSNIFHIRSFYLFAYIMILLLLLPFYYALIIALTIGFLPVFMVLTTLAISLLIPIFDSFNRKLA